MDGRGEPAQGEIQQAREQLGGLAGVGLHWSRGVVLGALLLGDGLALLLALEGVARLQGHRWGPSDLAWLPQVMALWLFLLARDGLYHRRRPLAAEARALALACLTAQCVCVLLLVTAPMAVPWDGWAALLLGPLSWALLLLTRLGVRRALFWLGPWRKRVAVVGAGEDTLSLARALEGDPLLGCQVVGLVTTSPTPPGPLPVLGELEQLEEIAVRHHIEDVVVADPGLSRERLDPLLARCEPILESVRMVAGLAGLPTQGAQLERVGGSLLLQWNQALQKPWNRAMKRFFDVAVGGAALLLALPVLGVCALAVRLDSPGGVLFTQARLGRRGRQFLCIKLRTMYADADVRLERWLAEHPGARAEWETFAKLREHDPRVTPVGRWLRRTSLDELPQLWHVITGEMSLVGPRPYLPSEQTRAGDILRTILVASPGLTGLWQVSGRNRLSFQDRLRLDAFYVRHWTLGTDLVILARTVWVVLSRHGAY